MQDRLFLKTILSVMLMIVVAAHETMAKNDVPLPKRASPRPKTTPGVPHIQIGVEPVPEVNAELLRRVYLLPGAEKRSSIISLPGAWGLWLGDSLTLVHPEVIIAGREFAHIHPDGSLHTSLAPNRADEAVQAGWAIRHPWASQREGWEGFVMLYTPQSMQELDVTFELIVDSYHFVTGQNIQASDYDSLLSRSSYLGAHTFSLDE